MKRIVILCISILICFSARAEKINGSVKSTDGRALKGVVVSDGLNTVHTDNNGAFSLEVDNDSRWIFISTPSGYRSSVTPVKL